MKVKTILLLVISIVSVLGASSLAYSALTSDGLLESETEGSTEIFSEDTTTSEESVLIDTPFTEIILPSETTIADLLPKSTTVTTQKKTTTQAPSTSVSSTQPPATNPATTQAPKFTGSAPDFTVYNTNGDSIKLSDYAGRAVVLNFWASWCPPCKAEMPDFNNMYKKYSGQNVVFLMINMTDGKRETKDTALNFVNSSGFSFPILFDTKQSASIAYGVSSIPVTVFISKSGDIVSKNVGQISASKLENGIKSIM